MSDPRGSEERLTGLELRFMTQENLLQVLDEQLQEANKAIDVLRLRCERLESQLQDALDSAGAPPNERPPHY